MSVVENYSNVFLSFYRGMVSNYSLVCPLVENRIPKGDALSYNPEFENILDELEGVLSKRNCSVTPIKGNLMLPRSVLLACYMCFADENYLSYVEQLKPFSEGALNTLESIEEVSELSGRPAGIAQQLELALDQSGNDISLAVIYLTLGTRAIARGLDSKILGQKISMERLLSWKTKVRPFGYNLTSEDPPGDTYHFWNNVLAGLSRDEKVDYVITRNLKRAICDFIYINAAYAVGLLRNSVVLNRVLDTHASIDSLGYSVGRALFDHYNGEKNPNLNIANQYGQETESYQ